MELKNTAKTRTSLQLMHSAYSILKDILQNAIPFNMKFIGYTYHRLVLLIPAVLILYICNNPAYAQSDSSGSIRTLSDIIETAVQNYPALKAREAETENYNQQIKAARTGYIPRLVIQEQVTYATANGVTGSFIPNEGMAIPTSGGNNNTGSNVATFGQYTSLVLTGPIYTFGKIKSSIDIKQAEFDISNAAYQNELFQHKINITEAYLSLLTIIKLVKNQELHLQRALHLQNSVIASTRSGIRPGTDSSYAAAEVAKSRLNLLEIQQKEVSARIRLSELMGISDETIQIDTTLFDKRLPDERTYSTDVVRNPLLQFYQSRIQYGEAKSKEIKRSYLPTINYMGAGMARGSGFSNTNPLTNYNQSFDAGASYQRYNYIVGAYLLWNILDYSKVRHTYKSNASTLTNFQYQYKEQELKLQGMVKNAKLEQLIAKEKIIQSDEQYKSARNAYNQSLARYENGLSILPELSQSMVLLNRAEADISIAQYSAWRALLSISASTGDIDLFMNQIK